MGKLLNVGKLFSSKSTKETNKKDFGSTSLLLKLTQNALEKVEQDVGSAWSIIPLSYILDLASSAHLSKLQKFFDLSQSDRADMAYLVSDVLKLRRSLVGGLVNICGLEVSKGNLTRASFSKAESLLNEFEFLSEQKSWDWVSFHENEYDFFLSLSQAAKISGYTYFLRKARKHYLNSSLALNKNYWQIPLATEIYKQAFKHILGGNGKTARDHIVSFYETNDESIIFQYKKENQSLEEKGSQQFHLSSRIEHSYGGQVNRITPADYHGLIEAAFKEDQAFQDVTTKSTISKNSKGTAKIIAKQEGLLAGLPVAAASFHHMDPNLKLNPAMLDGERFSQDDCILEIQGLASSVFPAERISLNFLSYLSGIATQTNKIVSLLAGSNISLLDTRKTLPGYRILAKYAVSIGGGKNHRISLNQMGMLKDNHIAEGNTITKQIENFFDKYPNKMLEVEIDSPEQLEDIFKGKLPHIILLDNMKPEILKECVLKIKTFNQENGVNILTEASGGLSEANIQTIKGTGVDFVSMGSITNSVSPIDFSLEWV